MQLSLPKRCIAAGSLVVISAAAIFGVISIGRNMQPDEGKTFSGYTELMRARQYKKAYDRYMASSYKKSIDYKGYKDIQDRLTASLGFSIDKRVRGIESLGGPKEPARRIVAEGIYPTGIAMEEYILIKEFWGWRILGFNVQSPLLEKGMQDKMREFINSMPPDAREGYLKMLESQGIGR